jgi:hypothetical protein
MHHGDQHNNNHPIPFNGNLLISFTHFIIIDTHAPGQNTKLSNNDDGFYAGWMIWNSGEQRIICRVYKHCGNCSKPSVKYPKCSKLVQYNICLDGYKFQHHRYMLIYNVASGIRTDLHEDILKKLRSTKAKETMARDGVNPDEQCNWLPPDADQQHHQLLLCNGSHIQQMQLETLKGGEGLELRINT